MADVIAQIRQLSQGGEARTLESGMRLFRETSRARGGGDPLSGPAFTGDLQRVPVVRTLTSEQRAAFGVTGSGGALYYASGSGFLATPPTP